MKRNIWKVVLCLVPCLLLGACGTGGGVTEPEGTKAPDIMQKSDPAEDDTLNLLMIGNSFCYYYTDELYGMAKAAGIKLRVCNVYYSGCTLKQHWTWWKDGEANYEFFTIDENGLSKVEDVDLNFCLEQQNWDYISLQGASGDLKTKSAAEVLTETQTYRTELWAYIKEQFPQSRHLWHHTWSYQVGYDRNGFQMKDAAGQAAYDAKMLEYATSICKEQGLERVNTGEAWRIVRDGGYDNLCARLAAKGGLGDYYHDGDIGGGQYLNACVWFEVLTGKSCIGNTWRPQYTLSEDMITMLQQAAHQAVSQMKAEQS